MTRATASSSVKIFRRELQHSSATKASSWPLRKLGFAGERLQSVASVPSPRPLTAAIVDARRIAEGVTKIRAKLYNGVRMLFPKKVQQQRV